MGIRVPGAYRSNGLEGLARYRLFPAPALPVAPCRLKISPANLGGNWLQNSIGCLGCA